MRAPYADASYARSMGALGRTVTLPRSGGPVFVRGIPGTDACDVIGPYPFFQCEGWDALAVDLAELARSEERPVSAVLVVDPLGGWPGPRMLRRAFPDVLRPFKPHYLVDLTLPRERSISAHHRRNAARGLERVVVDVTEDVLPHLDVWTALYAGLVERHGIGGVARFGREDFRHQMAVPGAILGRALLSEEVVGASLWYRAGERAWYHLAAYTERGYEVNASHAMFDTVLARLREAGVRWVNLGGGAGLAEDPDDGLVRFKRGWSTSSATAWLCGRVLDAQRYDALCREASGREAAEEDAAEEDAAPTQADGGSAGTPSSPSGGGSEVPPASSEPGFFPAYRAPVGKVPSGSRSTEEGDRGAA